jgi:REP element-mobilizing transposase RayT
MAGTFTALYYHLVFSTKHRQPFLGDTIRPRLFEFLGGITRKDDGVLIKAGGVEDHLHLLVSLPPKLAPSDHLRALKSKSSRWLKDNFEEIPDFGWQEGFGAFTVSLSNIEDVSAYIADQREHHRKKTFKEEFREFLKKHKLDYDEKTIWL